MIEQIASEIYGNEKTIADIQRGDSYRVPYASVRNDYSTPLSISHNTSYIVPQFLQVNDNRGNAFTINAANGTISVRAGIVATYAAVTVSPTSSEGMLYVRGIDPSTGNTTSIFVSIPILIPQGVTNINCTGAFVVRLINNETMRFQLTWYSKTASSLAVSIFYLRMLWFPLF